MSKNTISLRQPAKTLLQPALVFLIGLATVIYVLRVFIPRHDQWAEHTDWIEQFYVAGQHWRDPYVVPGFYNPPWVAWLLRPFTAFEPGTAFALWAVGTVLLAMWGMRRLGAPLQTALLCLLSPFYLRILLNGNIDALVLVGYAVLPEWPVSGTLLLLLKPQELGLVLLSKRYARRDVVLLLLALGVSFAVNGNWPSAIARVIIDSGPQVQPWNISIFPYGVPVAVALAAIGLRRGDPVLLAVASPFIAPYVNCYSFFPVLGIVLCYTSPWEQAGVVALSWAVVWWWRNSHAGWRIGYVVLLWLVLRYISESPHAIRAGQPLSSRRQIPN